MPCVTDYCGSGFLGNAAANTGVGVETEPSINPFEVGLDDGRTKLQ